MKEPGESFERDTEPAVRGYIHTPSSAATDALILTHGAGSNCRSLLLIALANTFSESGYLLLRCDLPYRQARTTGPPRPGDAARDREGLVRAVEAVRELFPGRIFLGGHSYGGRQSSMLVAEHPDLVSGLVLMSYPLHPPRNPQQLRVQHLPNLRVPTLFVHGTRDPFGTVEEMQSALKLIPAKTSLMQVQRTGHDLGLKGGKGSGDLPVGILGSFRELFG